MRCFLMMLMVVMTPMLSHAEEFAPTLLKLSAPEHVEYHFDGASLEMPVTVSGTPAGVVFCVFTRGKADEIGAVQNGFLGWHYVNMIDTCVYYSTLKNFAPGVNNLLWDGNNQDGNPVVPDEYTYYLWGFDNVGEKQKMMDFYYTGRFIARDEQGLPLMNPIYYDKDWRWRVGGDPLDESLLETSTVTAPDGWKLKGAQIDPRNFDEFFVWGGNDNDGKGSILKYLWAAEGESVLQENFGMGGYADNYDRGAGGSIGVLTDGEYLYLTDENNDTATKPDADFYIYDFQGRIMAEIDISQWWSDPASYEAGGQMNGGPNSGYVRDGRVFLNCACSCLNQMVNPQRYLETGLTENFVVWSNGNGDYVGDRNFEDTAELKWVCMDYIIGPAKYTIVADSNRFALFSAYHAKPFTFGVYAPDGTGLSYYAYAHEGNGWERSTKIIDDETPFDGLYSGNLPNTNQYDSPYSATQAKYSHILYRPSATWDPVVDQEIWFIGHDSISGVISSEPVQVEVASPADFTVEAPSPNPFNPSTTIAFTLPERLDTTVAIYNIAGQRVTVLQDGTMSAGRYTLTWDAAGNAAGVYFAVVQAEEYRDTVRMTLVK